MTAAVNPYFIAIAAAVVLDVATTLYNLSLGAREVNPLIRGLIGVLGVLPAMLVTHRLALTFVWHELPNMSDRELAVIAALWWIVVVWNFVQMWRQRRGS